MDLSSLVFVAIIGVWAAYLVPHWLSRRDDLAQSRTPDRFSGGLRVLQRRSRKPRPDRADHRSGDAVLTSPRVIVDADGEYLYIPADRALAARAERRAAAVAAAGSAVAGSALAGSALAGSGFAGSADDSAGALDLAVETYARDAVITRSVVARSAARSSVQSGAEPGSVESPFLADLDDESTDGGLLTGWPGPTEAPPIVAGPLLAGPFGAKRAATEPIALASISPKPIAGLAAADQDRSVSTELPDQVVSADSVVLADPAAGPIADPAPDVVADSPIDITASEPEPVPSWSSFAPSPPKASTPSPPKAFAPSPPKASVPVPSAPAADTREAEIPERPFDLEVAIGIARVAARRRARIMALLFVATVASWVVTSVSSMSAWVAMPATVLLLMHVLASRVAGLRSRESLMALAVQVQSAEVVHARTQRSVEAPAPSAEVAAAPAPTSDRVARRAAAVGAETWEPIPVPPPTYTLKPAVHRPEPAPLDLPAVAKADTSATAVSRGALPRRAADVERILALESHLDDLFEEPKVVNG